MVSIIISFYERLGHLKCCLDALALCPRDFDEVIIADDGSKGTTVDLLKAIITGYPFPITHVTHPKEGFRLSAARNNGIRHAQGDYLIFLDCDFVVLPGTIKYHLNVAKPGRFVVGSCKYLDEEGSSILLNAPVSPELLERFYRALPERDIITQHRRFIKRSILIRLHLASPRKQSGGSHLSVYKKDIELINGFDEDFIGWGGEDEDVSIRLTAAGIYCISAVRCARVMHVWHPGEPKAGSASKWKKGTFSDYINRQEIIFFCENGLRKKS